jgi:hypothetical protein
METIIAGLATAVVMGFFAFRGMAKNG